MLFRRVYWHFYDFGIRDTPLNFGNLLRCSLPIFEKSGCIAWCRKWLLPASRSDAGLQRRQQPFATSGNIPPYSQRLGGNL